MDNDKKREQTRERVKRYREKQKSVTSVTVSPESVTPVTLEHCRTCQVKLPPLEQPRQYPGKCFTCSCVEIPAKFGVTA